MRSGAMKVPGLLAVMGGLTGGMVGGFWSRVRGSAVLGILLGAVGGFMLELFRRDELRGDLASVPEIADYLSRHLGETVTAYLSGVDEPALVRDWTRGVVLPGPDERERLKVAYEAAQCLVEACGDEMTRSWFFGMNLSLRDTAPAYVLRHWEPKDWEDVLSAAQEFAEI